MNERDTGIRIKPTGSRGILHVRAGDPMHGLSRYWPSPDLAPFVEHYWLVRWDLSAPRIAETIPVASIHMVLESSGRAEIVGVMRKRFTRKLEGKGRVVGTKFRPGGFRPFVSGPVSAFTDRRIPLRDLWGPRAQGLGAEVMAHDDDRRGIAIIEAFLRSFQVTPSDGMVLARDLSERIAGDRALTRVEQLASRQQTHVRALQRLFNEHVGVGPKWVIQRFRLLDAAQRVAEGAIVDWSGLALDLGYSDQAHFIRDFKRLVGRSPAEYAKRLQGGGAWELDR